MYSKRPSLPGPVPGAPCTSLGAAIKKLVLIVDADTYVRFCCIALPFGRSTVNPDKSTMKHTCPGPLSVVRHCVLLVGHWIEIGIDCPSWLNDLLGFAIMISSVKPPFHGLRWNSTL